jgi:Mg2+ and Co2+ transporter CorA
VSLILCSAAPKHVMLTTEIATAGAAEYCAPSVIDEESDEDLVVPIFSKEEGNEVVLDVLRSGQDQHSAQSIPQDASLTPAALPNFAGSSTPGRNAVDESHISTRPSAPKIKIETSDPKASLPSPKGSSAAERVLEWTRRPRDDMTARPESRIRRPITASFVTKKPREVRPRKSQASMKHAQAISTPSPWKVAQIDPEDGCRVRVRCSSHSGTAPAVDIVVVYLYNSELFKKPHYQDADLDIFYHTKDAKSPSSQGMLKAKMIRREQSKDPMPETFAEYGERVNCLEEFDMLRQSIPGSRIITIGFDIAPLFSVISSLDKILSQLLRLLGKTRDEAEHIPIIFLGHVYGGILIIHTLSFLSKNYTHPALNFNIAGLFLFSYPVPHSPAHFQELADFYGARTIGVFSSGHSFMQQFQKSAASSLYSHHPQKEQHDVRETRDMAKGKRKKKLVRIGFPIFQFTFEGQNKEDKGYDVVRASSKIFGGVVETIHTLNHMASALKFSSSGHIIIQKILLSILYSLKTHHFFQAVVASDTELTQAIVRSDARANLRDRREQTALHIAVLRIDQSMVVSLLEVDVDPNVQDESLNTPLHYAVRSGNEAIIRALIYHGADTGLENNQKRTPRDLAEKHRSRRHLMKILTSRLVSGPDHGLSHKRIEPGTLPASKDGQLACKNFQITVTEIFANESSEEHWSVSVSIGALLYDSATLEDILREVRPREIKSKTPVCVWIHVPENNMVWVEDLFTKLGFHHAIWEDTQRPISNSVRNRTITPHFSTGYIRSFFIPYLSYESNTRQRKRTQFIKDVDELQEHIDTTEVLNEENAVVQINGTPCKESHKRTSLDQIQNEEDLKDIRYDDDDTEPDSSEASETGDSDDLEEGEEALIRFYLNKPPALHIRRTLDQYFYHMLESTQERDDDQVVTRWAAKKGLEDLHNILMVDQLWLWTLSQGDELQSRERKGQEGDNIDKTESNERHKSKFVISCFPSRTGASHTHRTMDDLRRLVLDPHRRRRNPVRKPEHLISRILETCLSIFDRLQKIPELHFFQMFEDSVGSIDDQESRRFDNFRRGSKQLLELNGANKHYNEYKNALMADLLDIREEIDLLVEVKDIRDELNIISSILRTQLNLASQMRTTEQCRPLLQTSVVEDLLLTDINDLEMLDAQAERTQDNLNTLMDLKQKNANAWEAREARETAVATRKQGSTLMVFTMVTIIFLPLSFMASFFAIGIAAFPKDRTSGQVSWPLRTVMGILFGVSLAVSTPLIVFALNMDYCASFHRELRNNYLTLVGIKLITRLFPLAPLGSSNLLIQWSERLQGIHEEYMRDIKKEQDGSLSNVEVDNATTTEDTEPGGAFLSTASSQVSRGVDIEMLCSRRSRWKRPNFGLWSRKMDNDLPSDEE